MGYFAGNVGIGTTSFGVFCSTERGARNCVRRQPNNAIYAYVDELFGTFTKQHRDHQRNAAGSGTLLKLRLAGQGGVEIASDARACARRWSTSGNVGIGTTTPGATSVSGNGAEQLRPHSSQADQRAYDVRQPWNLLREAGID